MKGDTIRYRGGYKYELSEDYTVVLPLSIPKGIATDWFIMSDTGVLTVIRGYAWDGPSGPAIDTGNFMRGSLIHDVLYQMMREGLLSQDYRMIADEILRVICLEDGMCTLRAWWVYHGVRLGAGPCSRPENDRPIKEAP